MKLLKLSISAAILAVSFHQVNAKDKGYWWGPKDMEERGKNSVLNRLEIGYNTVMLSETKYYVKDYDIKKNPNDPLDRDVIHDSYRLKMRYGSKGIVAGMAFPLVKVDRRTATIYYRTALSLYTGIMANLIEFDNDSIRKVRGIEKDYLFRSYNGGALIGLDYKYGSDALNTAATKIMYSVGAGIYPNIIHSRDYDKGVYDAIRLSARPYLKGEFGFYAGIAFKVRAVVMGKNNYVRLNYEWESDYAATSHDRTVKSRAEVNFSIIMMPFSYGWKKY